MRLLRKNIVNIKWTFQNQTEYVPFLVPNDIVFVNRSDLSTDYNLTDFVNITQDAGGFTIEVRGLPAGPTVYILKGILLDNRFMQINHVFNTKSDNF